MSSTTTTAAGAGNGGVQLLDDGPSKGYELSGKIMLSAIIVLFVVVVVMVCLHLYARWYLLRSRHRRRALRNRNRRSHLVFYLDSNSSSDAANGGLDPSIVKSIPTFMYSEKEERESEEVPECAVCLSEFVEGERGRVLPKCGHSFHVECIDMWFHSHSTCPLCRAPVEAESTISADAVVIEIMETESTRTESVIESERREEEKEEVTGSESAATDQVVAVPIWERRKKAAEIVGVSIEVPSRNDSVDSDESGSTSQAFRSPIQSLKRILSREKRPLPSPGTGTSRAPAMATVESESENGRDEV